MYNEFGSHPTPVGTYKIFDSTLHNMEEDFYIEPALDNLAEYRVMLENARNCFSIKASFLERMGFDLPEPTAEDRKEAMQIYHETPDAPPKPTTLGAARVLDKMLAKHDYVLEEPTNKMRNYVMYRLFEHAEDPDPKVSLKALEYLAKSSDVGLFTEKVEININQKSTVELETDLTTLIKNIANRGSLPSSSSTYDAEYTEL